MKATRRRMIALLACAASLPIVPGLLVSDRRAGRYLTDWRGSALGADARMRVAHDNPEKARVLIRHCLAEVERLENIFSLYRQESELSVLNRDGRLDRASHDLLYVLSQAHHFSVLTGGRFDVTVQPLWLLYAAPGIAASPAEITATQRLVDYRNVALDGDGIRLVHPGMAVTLNGIAQGYISDRVADICRDSGFEHVLVQMGETVGVNPTRGGDPWRIGFLAEEDNVLVLRNQAVASSGAVGNRPSFKHIFDPVSGRAVETGGCVHVVAPDALTADAVSTALLVLPPTEVQAVIDQLSSVTVHAVRDRIVTTLSASPPLQS